MKTKTQKIVMSAMLAALVCVATMIIKIPSFFKGYINLGDAFVLLSGFMLSPLYSFLAAGTGSALADIFSGYIVYAPATFIIKGIMAVLFYYIEKSLEKRTSVFISRLLAAVTAELFMAAGYYIFEGFLYGFLPSAVNIIPNLIQALAGIVLAMVLFKVVKKLS